MIVAGGCIDDTFTLDYLRLEHYDVKYAVDSGLHFFLRQKLVPDYIVGDFDSVEEGVLQEYQHLDTVSIIRLNPKKDDTDTEHALQMALDKGMDEIHLFGATGSRLDHVLGNLQLLGLALRKNVECILIDPWNRTRLINKETTISREEQFGAFISLIPYTPKVTGLTLTGFLYPLKDYTMSSFYIEDAAAVSGVSNEIVAETARISLNDGILVLIESRDDAGLGTAQ